MFKLVLEKAEETDKIANICWIIEKAREFQKNIYFCFIDYAKTFDCLDSQQTVENSSRDVNTRPPDLPPVKFLLWQFLAYFVGWDCGLQKIQF